MRVVGGRQRAPLVLTVKPAKKTTRKDDLADLIKALEAGNTDALKAFEGFEDA